MRLVKFSFILFFSFKSCTIDFCCHLWWNKFVWNPTPKIEPVGPARPYGQQKWRRSSISQKPSRIKPWLSYCLIVNQDCNGFRELHHIGDGISFRRILFQDGGLRSKPRGRRLQYPPVDLVSPQQNLESRVVVQHLAQTSVQLARRRRRDVIIRTGSDVTERPNAPRQRRLGRRSAASRRRRRRPFAAPRHAVWRHLGVTNYVIADHLQHRRTTVTNSYILSDT